MPRGGSRAGSGRKPALSDLEALQVGAECERLLAALVERQALERYSRTKSGRLVEAAQSRTALVPVKQRSRPSLATRDALAEVTEDIDYATDGNRLVTLPIRRAYKTDAVLLATVEWCSEMFGKNITAGKVRACLKDYRAFKKWAENKDSLKKP